MPRIIEPTMWGDDREWDRRRRDHDRRDRKDDRCRRDDWERRDRCWDWCW